MQAAAQQDPLAEARQLTGAREYTRAIEIFRKIYSETPGDEDVYRGYLKALMESGRYKDAEKLVQDQMGIRMQSPFPVIDLGQVYHKSGKDKKATEQFTRALGFINGDDILTQQIARAFTDIGNDAYAILAYERGRDILRNPYLYYSPLARLYAATGDMDKAVQALLDGGAGNPGGSSDIKAHLLELTGEDSRKLQLVQKALLKRINAEPENIYYADILTWLYTQKDDWDGAFIQIRAIDERNREGGRRVLDLVHSAVQQGRYEAALKALDFILAKGKEQPLYAVAAAEKLQVRMRMLDADPASAVPEVTGAISKEYAGFFTEYPQYATTQTLLEYARLEAQYNNRPETGVALIEQALSQPAASRQFSGAAKLQLGDYYLLAGRIWDASLIYSQVDKAFREDMLGEEARFRNARLAYYRGDFGWAQAQLSVLKASTSELIANDALYLSVLITENITPDSNLVPLQRFAYADLLLFQNRDREASALLDSLLQAFPDHPLNDDILLLHARLSEKRGDYEQALAYLARIYGSSKYRQDVLGDDAVYRTALIYDQRLKQKEKAAGFYEQLIVDYPGSTYVQSARQKLSQLHEGTQIP